MNKRQKSKYLKATAAMALVASTVVVAAPIASAASNFKDVQTSHQFYDAIKSLSDRGIINGFPDGTFKPGHNLTRGQAAKIIAGVLGLNTTNVINPNFKDIPTTHQYYGAIAALKQAGIIDGYEDGTFRQGANIERNHVAKIIANALNLTALNSDALPFTDVRADYKEAIAALYENNVTTGKTATLFDGSSYVTRGQMAAFITRAEKAVTPEAPQAQTITFKLADYTNDAITVNGTAYSFNAAVKSIFTSANKAALSGAAITATVENGAITKVSNITLNNAGTADSLAVFDTNATIDSLTVNADNIAVKNVTVTGNATVTSNVMTAVEFDGATVMGSLIMDNTVVGALASLNNRFAQDGQTGPKLTMKNTRSGNVHVKRNDISIESDTTIPEITIAVTVSMVNIDGTVTKVTVDSTVNLEITGNATIGQLLVTTAVDLALNIVGVVGNLIVNNPDAEITVSAGLRINELVIPAGSTAAGIITNYAAIASQILNVIIGTTPSPGAPSPGTGGNDNSGGSWTPPPVDPSPGPTTPDMAVIAVDAAIEALPTADSVTLSDETAVNNARALYNALTAAQQNMVKQDNIEKLSALETRIAELKGQEPGPTTPDTAVIAVDAAIEALPTADSVTLSDETAVNNARALYNALTAAQQNMVKADNIAKLSALETRIAELKGQEPGPTTPDTAVITVDAAIEALPTAEKITLADETAVNEARGLYNALTTVQQNMVKADNVAKLSALETRIAELKNVDTESPILMSVFPVKGTEVNLADSENFTLEVKASDANLRELEIDHSMTGLPEFSVYANEANPYGTDEARTAFEALGGNVTYNEGTQTWLIDFGANVTTDFVDKGNVSFYLVLKDEAGNTWGSMDPTTAENTFNYTVKRDQPPGTTPDTAEIDSLTTANSPDTKVMASAQLNLGDHFVIKNGIAKFL